MAEDPSEPSDFFSLSVNYQEKILAAGRTSGGFFKREGKTKDHEGLCHISELSTSWLAKAEDAVKVGDTIDVKLIEINGRGQLRLSRRALLPDSNTENSGTKQCTVDLIEESTEKGKQNSVTKAVEVENAELSNELSVDIKVRRSSKSKPVEANTLMENMFVKKWMSSAKDALESDRNRSKKSSD